MKKNRTLFQKSLSFITGLLLVLQSLAPGFLALRNYAFAQETTPAPTEQTSPTPEETIAPTPEPTATPTVEVTPEATPEPTVEATPTEEVTPVPTEAEQTLGATSSEPPHETSPPTEGEILDGVTTTAAPTPTPTVTTQNDTESVNADLSAVVIENVKADSLNLSAVDPSSAQLSTDKADYAPTDTAVISGTGFKHNHTYDLTIKSDDPPATSTTVEIKTDNNGSFLYAYQLDGNYRPNYQVFVTDAGSTIASTTFTDSPPSGCSNDSAGANDQPNQKDLTKMCVTYGGSSDAVSWNWDDTSFNGNNTGDACSLYDTDGNGLVNFAVCVGVGGNPAAFSYRTVYSCGDNRSDRCDQPVTPINNPASTCSASVVGGSNPFDSGSDTVANCTIQHADFGGAPQLVDVCSFPSGNPNSDPSDCINFKPNAGKLTVTKVLSPSNDSGLFNLQVDGVTQTGGANVGNGGTTLTAEFGVGNHTVGETAGNGTSLSNYTSSIVCKLLHGTGSVVTTTGTNPWTLSVTDGSDILCTITNTRNQGTLVVHKTFTDQHSNSGITINVTGAASAQGTTNGSGDATFSNLTPGTYSATAVEPNGYYQSATTCTNVSVASGQTTNCTITDSPIRGTITVHKVLVGTSTSLTGFCFTLSPDPNMGQVCASVNGDAVFSNVPAGTYTASETASAANYTQTNTTCNSNMVITNNGDSKSCTVTNTRNQGTIELKKVWSGTGGQTTLNIGTTAGASDVDTQLTGASGAAPLTTGQDTVDTGTYYVSETGGLIDYSSVLSCTDNGSPVTPGANNSVSVTTGHAIVCTFTNTRNTGSVKVNKLLDGDGDGSFETLNPGSFNWSLDGSGTNAMGSTVAGVNTGSHDVNENSVTDYHFVGWYLGHPTDNQYSCTNLPGYSSTALPISISVTNDSTTQVNLCNARDTGTVKVHKDVVNPDGGAVTDTSHSFGVSLDGANEQTLTDDGVVTYNNVPTGTHTVTESTIPSDYSLDGITPDSDGGTTGAQITVVSGQITDVYVTNKQKHGHITGSKWNDVNGDGQWDEGEGTLSGWTIFIDENENGLLDGQEISTTTDGNGNYDFTVNPGTYRVCEVVQDGWKKTYPDTCHDVTVGSNGTSEGNNFGNQGRGTIIIKKDVVPDSEELFRFTLTGRLIESEFFPLGDNGSKEFHFPAGSYAISESENPLYTTQVQCVSDQDDSESPGELVLDPGETITCTFTNTRNTGSVKVNKLADTDGNGTFETFNPGSFTWSLDGSGSNAMGSTVSSVVTGSHDVNESSVTDYHFVGWYLGHPTDNQFSCTNLPEYSSTSLPISITVATDATTQINLCNARDTGNVNVHKVADTDGDGKYDSTDSETFTWGTQSDITNNVMGQSTALETGNYNIFENSVPGYQFVGWFPGGPRNSDFSCTNLPEGAQYQSLPTNLAVSFDETTEITLCNQLQNPILTISKINDAGGDKAPGDSVLFTITVTATQSAAHNVVVTDLPASGFTYHAGSWTANSSVRGDIKNAPTTEPTYASPGAWQLGDMVANEIVTLTYVADIASDQKPGLYKDLVWAFGCKFEINCSVGDGNDVLASAIDPGFVSENYAGTHVNIVASSQSSASVNLQGQVLGASTELPATGAATIWLILALLSLTGGIGLVIAGKLIRRHYA